MFSPNPAERTLAILAYVGIILGIIVTLAGRDSITVTAFGVLFLFVGILSMVGGLVVSGITYKAPKPPKL
jgi:hypothetical protein